GRDETVKREVEGGERGRRSGGSAVGKRGHRSVAD
ncbi:hypothetical protein A2U01_0095001, partial [Trifolium medium]|nr:hypothetical protein [Trifolium medium]